VDLIAIQKTLDTKKSDSSDFSSFGGGWSVVVIGLYGGTLCTSPPKGLALYIRVALLKNSLSVIWNSATAFEGTRHQRGARHLTAGLLRIE